MNTAELYESIRPRYPELTGKVALVTGSSRGIGKGIALRLAREGMRLVLNGRNPEHLEATATEFSALGTEILPVLADVAQAAEVDEMFDQAVARFGTVNLLVNNAAVMSTHYY